MQDKINKYFNTIATNIKSFRENANLSQEALAEKLNLSREFINRVENGKERFSLQTLLAISVLFEISPEDFFK